MANRLAGSASPYLRLHAGNPVDWYPWGEEAFIRARTEQKPIFLSIGYFSCHWCHVMERESFADAAIAEQLNRDFVSIKLDREERPDVDRVYMHFVQASTGSGGWPLSVFLTPELEPFFGGTYFPPRDRYQMPGFPRVIAQLAQAWQNDRARLRQSAVDITAWLRQSAAPAMGADEVPELTTVATTLQQVAWPGLFQHLRSSFDTSAGGFGGAPKFPRTSDYAFLLRYAHQHRDKAEGDQAREMTLATLRAMAAGGIQDQIGGGFHRYAVDGEWRVPHFEKMLYDQAQIAIAYVEAWQISGDAAMATVARDTLDFVLRELTSPAGMFYSALDADSAVPNEHRQAGRAEHGEGAYYLWTAADFDACLTPEQAAAAKRAWGVTCAGNVAARHDPHQEFSGKNILHGSDQVIVAEPELAAARAALLKVRARREPPGLDGKVITAWNGLMISALARASTALNEGRYLEAAQRAASEMKTQLWDANASTLLRRDSAMGQSPIAAFAEDYACLIQALLDLHQADFDPTWLAWARELQERQEALFAAPGGGYFAAAVNEHVLVRQREEYDGAEPAASSVALANLVRLGYWLEDGKYWRTAAKLLAAFGERLQQAPAALPFMVAQLETASAPPRSLTIRGSEAAADTREMLLLARRQFLPGWFVVQEISAAKASFVICQDNVCELPKSRPETLLARLAPAQVPR